MFDMNFFSVYKKRRAKSKGLVVFLVVFIVFLIMLNGLLIGGGLYLFGQIEQEIADKEAWINDPATREKIQEAAQIRQEADLVEEYYTLIQTVGDNMVMLKHVDSALFDDIRQLTPVDVEFMNMMISGRQLNITCIADSVESAMDMYHAFSINERFVNVMVSNITVDQENEKASFSINFAVKED